MLRIKFWFSGLICEILFVSSVDLNSGYYYYDERFLVGMPQSRLLMNCF